MAPSPEKKTSKQTADEIAARDAARLNQLGYKQVCIITFLFIYIMYLYYRSITRFL